MEKKFLLHFLWSYVWILKAKFNGEKKKQLRGEKANINKK